MKWRNIIGWLLVIIALVFVVAIWTTINKLPRKNNVSGLKQSVVTKLPSQLVIFPSDPVRGSAEASLTVVEFGDFECAYCAQVASTIEQLISANPGKIKLVWKDFPLPNHLQSLNAAEAAQCAGKQGKFWEYHDALFRAQDSLSSNTYLRLAGEVGLDATEFMQCLQNNDMLPFIQLNVNEGMSIGVDGTPFFVINGQPFSGILTEQQILSLMQ